MKWVLGLTLSLAALGCHRGGGQKPAYPVDRNPKVSDDAQQIAEVRKLHQQEKDALFNRALEQVRQWDFLESRSLEALKRRRDQATTELKRIMTAGRWATDASRGRAARVLFLLGDPESERFLFDAIKTGPAPLRAVALKMIGNWDMKTVDLSNPERTRLILSGLDDPDPEVVAASAGLCADRKLPGTEGKLVELLKSGRAKDPRSIATQLAEIASSPEAIEVMLTTLLRDRPERYHQWIGFVLQRLIEDPDPKISEPVRTAFLRYALGYQKPDRYDQSVARDLARVAERETIPLLEDIMANARDPVSRVYALEAVVRLNPEGAVDKILDFIRRGGDNPRVNSLIDAKDEKALHAIRFQGGDMTVGTLRKYAKEKDAERIIAVLVDSERRPTRPVLSLEVVRLLIEHLGTPGRRAVEEAGDRLEASARMWAMWKLKGLSLDSAIDELRTAGVIGLTREAVHEKMHRAREPMGEKKSEPVDTSDPQTLTEALASAGIVTSFDVESDEIPCNHHHLVMEFAENSGGRFQPECAVQTWHQKDQEDLDAPYTVRFLYRGRLYRFDTENLGDWYDVEAVYRALNFALTTAGQKERFIGLETGGQTAAFVCADPEAFLPIAKKYGLPLSNDPDAAVRAGKEFDRKVFEGLQRKGEP